MRAFACINFIYTNYFLENAKAVPCIFLGIRHQFSWDAAAWNAQCSRYANRYTGKY